ncbi:MAG: CTP synthase, partial [Leptospiraceae bacterium]|nr:CTP synthase [Leptospiraceae bacterium]
IYEIPKMYKEEKLDEVVLKTLKMDLRESNFSKWEEIIYKIKNPQGSLKIAIVGKYISLQDAYRSIYESLSHGGIENNLKVEFVKLNPEDIEKKNLEEVFKDIAGILVPGGFGERGIEGKIRSIQYARTKNIPFFGICLGMQCAVIEFARNVLGWEGANSTEFNPTAHYPVISLLEEQMEVDRLGGTMRLGSFPCILKEGSLAYKTYRVSKISERHRHRFEFTLKYRKDFEENGMLISGLSPDEKLVEIVEIPNHPWFIGVQFHPEFQSKPTRPHPLFVGFIRAAKEYYKKHLGENL